jgi:hypothetical protein
LKFQESFDANEPVEELSVHDAEVSEVCEAISGVNEEQQHEASTKR